MEVLEWNRLLLAYEQAVDELTVKFSSLAREYKRLGVHSPIEQVEGRVKRVASILAKANKKNIAITDVEAKMEDIAGVRIICKFVEDIDRVISILRDRSGQDMKILKERDYIQNTKPSGYRSYHVIISYPVYTADGRKEVLAEVQIRTLAMNFWATIEHSLKYKYLSDIPDEIKERLVKSAEAAFKLDKEMSTIRGEIMDAQKSILIESELVDEIQQRIVNLHKAEDRDELRNINKQFYNIYNEGSDETTIDKLVSLNQQLKIKTETYKIQYV